jgi:hypothetical protein
MNSSTVQYVTSSRARQLAGDKLTILDQHFFILYKLPLLDLAPSFPIHGRFQHSAPISDDSIYRSCASGDVATVEAVAWSRGRGFKGGITDWGVLDFWQDVEFRRQSTWSEEGRSQAVGDMGHRRIVGGRR